MWELEVLTLLTVENPDVTYSQPFLYLPMLGLPKLWFFQ